MGFISPLALFSGFRFFCVWRAACLRQQDSLPHQKKAGPLYLRLGVNMMTPNILHLDFPISF